MGTQSGLVEAFGSENKSLWPMQSTVSFEKPQQVTAMLGPQAAALSAPGNRKRAAPFEPSMPPGILKNARVLGSLKKNFPD